MSAAVFDVCHIYATRITLQLMFSKALKKIGVVAGVIETKAKVRGISRCSLIGPSHSPECNCTLRLKLLSLVSQEQLI